MAATPHGPFPDISDIARLARAKLQRAQGTQAQPQTAEDLRRAYDAALADTRAKFTERLDGIIAQVQASAPEVPIAATKDGDGRTYAVLGETLTLRYYDLPPRAAAGVPGSVIKIAGTVAIYRRARAAAGHPRRLWDPALGEVGCMPCTWASRGTRRDRGSPAPWMSSASWSSARRWPASSWGTRATCAPRSTGGTASGATR